MISGIPAVTGTFIYDLTLRQRPKTRFIDLDGTSVYDGYWENSEYAYQNGR